MFPDRAQAEQIIEIARARHGGLWVDHSRMVAYAAEKIARNCAMDPQKAYVAGLLHDVGRSEDSPGLHHIVAGYELLSRDGWDGAARICLTHSFPCQDETILRDPELNCDEAEIALIKARVLGAPYDQYDRLIQLCDTLGSAKGICVLEMRLMDVAMRHGITPFSLDKWKAFVQIKARFDELCGGNIYTLFAPEIAQTIAIWP